MELLFFTPWHPHPNNPTLGNFILRQAELLRQRHRVRLVGWTTEATQKQLEVQEEGPDHLFLHFNGSSWRQTHRAYTRLRQWATAGTPPEVLVGCIPHQSGLWARRLHKWHPHAPLLYIEHWSGHLPERGATLSLKQRIQLRAGLKRAQTVLPVSEQLGQLLHQRYGNPFRVWRNPVDPTLFYPQAEKQFDFVHLSTLDSNKNPLGILRAFAQVLRFHPQSTLSIGGDGPTEPLNAEVQRLGIQKSVEVHGPLSYSEAARRIRLGRCLVQFSGYENLPCTISEALTAGLWVVSSRVGGIAEVVRHGHCGTLVAPGDHDALQSAMEEFLRMPIQTKATYRESDPEYLLDQFDQVLRDLPKPHSTVRT
ncbi:glycosyltransferase [bacterium]|nr:glycosyltransferase [bacterium]